MADLLDGIARYLDGLGLLTYDPDGTSGDTFPDLMPPTPDEAVALGSYGLGEPDPVTADDESGLQVRCRGPLSGDPRPSRAKAMAVYGALHGLTDTALPDGTWLELAVAQQTPSPIGQDALGRHEHVVNFRIHTVNPTANRT
ncbi:minor capsid protein [Kitasatospora fiedleri]|uniref:minor capsid protein n=1 Tax=Kitasatospora fiedleri TaxID=2991545 RepID=UPI00249A5208|nr:minor capsid protein [Kitasatospora fiedleri]